MPKIDVLKFFKYSDVGYRTDEYPVGEHDVSDNCAAFAIGQGLAKIVPTAKAKAASVEVTADVAQLLEGRTLAQLVTLAGVEGFDLPEVLKSTTRKPRKDVVAMWILDQREAKAKTESVSTTPGANEDDDHAEADPGLPDDDTGNSDTTTGDEAVDQSAPSAVDGTETAKDVSNGPDDDQAESNGDSETGDAGTDETGDELSVDEVVPPPINATPAARTEAVKRGIDLATVTGTGADGRIGINDVSKVGKA